MRRHGGPRVVLVGLMGAGKTAVGRVLASRLGVPLLDNDALLETSEGASRGALLASVGETAFAQAEVDVALKIIRTSTPFVGGLPAGVVLDPRVREALLEDGHPVCAWLRARLETLVDRLRVSDVDRPRLEGPLEAAIARLAPAREAAFREVAELVVDVEGRSPQALAAHLALALGWTQGA